MGAAIGGNAYLPVVHELIQGDGSVVNRARIVGIDRSNRLSGIEPLGGLGSAKPRVSAFNGADGQTRARRANPLDITTGAKAADPSQPPRIVRCDRAATLRK